MNIKTNNPASPTTAEAALLNNTQKSEAVAQAGRPRVERANHATGAHPGGYNVALSAEAKDLKEAHRKAYEIASQTPAVREERVKALKKRIEEGTYEVDSGKIADGMLREAIKDRLALGDQ